MMNVNSKIKLELNRDEIQSLLNILSNYNVFSLQTRNIRYMVSVLLGKFHLKIAALQVSGAKTHTISLSSAQAAAFDEAFVQTPFLEMSYHLNEYEEVLIDRIIYLINSQL
ncbi:MAG: hypothetical protein JXR34_10655 [Bacteroidales bacterium]|nr:hypothetical protein [Bacteroidales bacterium]